MAMKHVYPPRHPAWLDDKSGQASPAGADAPQALPTQQQDEAGKGGTAGAAQPVDDGRKQAADGRADPARRP